MAPARDADGNLVLLLVDEATGKTLRRHEGRAEADAEERRARSTTSAITAAKGYTVDQGHELFARSTASSRTSPCRPTATAAIRPRALDRGRARSRRSATTRANDRSSGSATARSSATTAGARSSHGERRGARAGLEDVRRLPATSARSSTTRSSASRSCASSSGRSSFAASDVVLSFCARALPRDHARQAGDALPARLPDRCSIIPYAIPGFLSLLVWQGLLNDDFGVVNQTLPHRTSRGSSTRTGRRSP